MFYILAITVFLLGLSIGSFLNVLINRLKNKKSILGRSECENCNHQLALLDLIPIFSFLFLKGKCRYCNKKISLQYIFVELITGILFVFAFISQFYLSKSFSSLDILVFIRNIFFIISFISIFVYDIKYMEVPDEIVILCSIIIFILNVLITNNLQLFLLGGGAGALFFLAQFFISKGKWIGGGDIRIGLLIGVSFGNIYSIFLTILFGYILGSIYSIPLLVKKYISKEDINSMIPLGPFLSVASIIMLFIIKYLL